MNEKPLERLNYYNGQRLEANDLKLEQEYHIRVRRWLNKSLYSSGIARGLEVRAGQGDLTVVVGPGLALDAEGREIILLEPESVPVMGQHSKIDGEVEGNYLTIQYREQTLSEEEGGCSPRNNGHDKSGSRLAWGGPARLLAKPILGWSDILPHESSGKIALGQVELDEKCQVRRFHVGVRRYVGTASAAKVHQYALDGERNIDSSNSGLIYFHIRGRQPNAVTLYLRAEQFSTLFYTEMGTHRHDVKVNSQQGTLTGQQGASTGHASHVDAHIHQGDPDNLNLTGLSTLSERQGTNVFFGHSHPTITSHVTLEPKDQNGNPRDSQQGIIVSSSKDLPGQFKVELVTTSPTSGIAASVDLTRFGFSVSGGEHYHDVVGSIGSTDSQQRPDPEPESTRHTHTIPELSASLAAAGVDTSPPLPARVAYTARNGPPLTYVDDLQVSVGRVDETGLAQPAINLTANILAQLRNIQPTQAQNWSKLGGGPTDPNHLLIKNGTGPIRLDFLSSSLSFPEGNYYIELTVASGGGRILYNLYVE